MSLAALVLCVANFVLIGALPKIFFKQGVFNLRWLATAFPFVITPTLMILGATGHLEVTFNIPEVAQPYTQGVAVICAAFSIYVIGMTIGCHRVPLALWHQDDDAPQQIVTWGPYRFVRHPFYSAFLLCFVGACLLFPHWGVLAFALYQLVILNVTAAREEKRLAASEFGEEYAAYAKSVGRFFPKL